MNNNNLIAQLADDVTPVQPISILRRLVLTFSVLIMYITLVPMLFGARPDWAQQMATLSYQLEMGISIALTFSAAFLAVRLAVPTQTRFPYGWLIGVAALAIGAVIGLLGEVSMQGVRDSFASNHYYITAGVIAFATPVAAALFISVAKGATTQPALAGLASLLSASAAGHFIMRTIGQSNNYAEVLLWCYSPVLILALIGFIMGQKYLRW